MHRRDYHTGGLGSSSLPVHWLDKKTDLNGDGSGYYRNISYWPVLCLHSLLRSAAAVSALCFFASARSCGALDGRGHPQQSCVKMSESAVRLCCRGASQSNKIPQCVTLATRTANSDNITTTMVRFVFMYLLGCIADLVVTVWVELKLPI